MRRLGQWLLLAAIYAAAGRFGMLFAETQENISQVWPPTGIALAAVLLFGYGIWPGIALGAFLVNIMSPAPLGMALATVVGNPLEALTGAYLLHVAGFDNRFNRVRDVIAFVLAAMLGTAISATIGGAALYLSQAAAGASFTRLWLHWWLGNFMGGLIVAPFVLVWTSRPAAAVRVAQHRRYDTVALFVSLAVIAAISYVCFGGWIADVRVSGPGAFMLYPLLIWMALRFGQHGTTSAIFLVMSMAIVGIWRGHGPLSRPAPEETFVYLHIFLTAASISALLLAAAIAERQQLQLASFESEQRFRELCESSPIGIFQSDAEGNVLYANARALEITGLNTDHAMGFNWVPFVHEDDRERLVNNWVTSTRARREFQDEARFVDAGGNVLWVRSHARTMPVLGGLGYVGIVENVSEQKRLEGQLQHYTERLRTLSRRLLDVQESERRHLARELHDEIGQMLTGLHFTLEAAGRDLGDTPAANLHDARAVVKDLTARVRDISLRLRPSMLDDLGLLPALLWHFERFTASTQIRVHFEHNLAEARFTPEIETAAYRVIQESLTNVARHAGIQEVTVRLWVDDATLHLQVTDHGVGFDAKSVITGSHTSGLTGMFERVDLLKGELTIRSTPGIGTQLSATLPTSNGVARKT